jgi:TonB family protein
VLANNDQLKLASDGIGRIGETASHLEQPGAYDAPEMAGGRRSTAADVWSLGMTLAEVLTQRRPAWNAEDQADPALKASVPSPFQEIVRGCLRRDPKSRFTVADISERLYAQPPKPQPRAAAAAPLSQKPPVPARREATPIPGIKPWIWRSAFPVACAVVGVAVLFTGFGYLRRQYGPQPDAVTQPPDQKPQTQPKPQSDQVTPAPGSPTRASRGGVEAQGSPTRASRGGVEAAKPDARHVSRKPEPGHEPASADVALDTTTVVKPQEASLRSAAQPPAGNLSPGGGEPDRDAGSGVVHRVLPDVPKSASETITGTIKVNVKVKVDASGNVAGAEMVVPGPSKYFARLALESAQKWKFATSQDSGRGFLLHFEFRNDGTKAYATR